MNNDLISRSALLEEFEWLKANIGTYNHAELNEHIQRIKNAPAVDAEPVRRGEWVISESPAHLSTIKCSECGTMYQRRWKAYCNYCPNCGAKMDGDSNETD